MTQCFAFLSTDAALLDIARQPLEVGLDVIKGAPKGWGLAYYQNGQPLLRKHPRPVEGPLAFEDITKSLKSSMLLGQTRGEGDERNINENTPPFRFRNWTFVYSGSVPRHQEVRPEILSSMPDFLKRNVKGATDVEIVFHLYLSFLNDAGKLDDPRIPSRIAGRALSSALTYLDTMTGSGDAPYCCFAANGHILLAKHRNMPLYLTRNSSYDNVGTTPDERPISYPHLKAIAVVGGKTIDAPGWETVDDSAVMAANRDLDIELLSSPAP